MPKYAQIDANGFIVGVSNLSDEIVSTNVVGVNDNDFNTLLTRFYKAKYESGQWFEGATQEEIDAILNPPPTAEQTKIEQLEMDNALILMELAAKDARIAQAEADHATLLMELAMKGVI